MSAMDDAFFESCRPQLEQGAAQLGLHLTAGQVGQLLRYLQLLGKWNAVYNLTAVREPARMLTHHLLDSMAAVPAFAGARRVLDVGAGGGLPGMVLAICLPDTQIAMIDAVHKKTAFLTQAKSELGLQNVTVHTGRVEQLTTAEPFDVITSRAFAELKDFIDWSAHLLAPAGRFIAMKGVAPKDEIARLPHGWKASELRALQVPGLAAERHLAIIVQSADGDQAGQERAP